MSKTIGTAKLSSKYQMVLPEAVRKKLDAESGDIVLFFENSAGEIVIKVKV